MFNGQSEDDQTDLVVIHPRTTYIHGRPSPDTYRGKTNGKERYTIPAEKLGPARPLMVLVRWSGKTGQELGEAGGFNS